MRKVILGLAVSLDGYIEGPDGEYDWCFTDQDYGMADFFKRIDALFIGRKSYELMQQVGDEAVPGMPPLKEYVFSKTLTTVKDGVILVNGNVKEAVEKIKSEKGKDIWLFGGASLTAALLQLKLIDEFWLSVHPIILGSGKPLFSHIPDRTYLQLLENKTYDSGLVSLKYALAQK
ncbi:MAG: dihydrofolate reductase family protein [Chitinophagaceae bacterium]